VTYQDFPKLPPIPAQAASASGQLLSHKIWQTIPTADERLRPVLVFITVAWQDFDLQLHLCEVEKKNPTNHLAVPILSS